tara:strand:+ start:851 stop:1015 length:165 start_codon:yes stop_codon:yes gene_type:complete
MSKNKKPRADVLKDVCLALNAAWEPTGINPRTTKKLSGDRSAANRAKKARKKNR